MELGFKEEQNVDNSLLILDDDDVFRIRNARSACWAYW
mgnify:CR=1 FL=1